MSPVHYYSELYDFDYYFFLGWEQQAFIDYVKKHFDHESEYDEDAKGSTEFNKDAKPKAIYVWIKPGQCIPAVLVHEVKHVVSETHKWVGIKACHKNDEAEAYLSEHLYRKALGIEPDRS